MKYILVLFLSIVTTVCFAQNARLGGLSYTYFPKSEIKDNPNPDEQVAYTEFSAFVRLPTISKNKKNIWINGFRYDLVRPVLYNSGGISGVELSQDYHTILYSLTWIHSINKKWGWVVSAMPTIASDLEKKISSDDFLLQAAGWIQYTVNEKLNMGLGATYFTGFGKAIAAPVFSLNYIGEKVDAAVLLPLSAEVFYKSANKKIRMGIRAIVAGNNYTLGSGYTPAGAINPIVNAEYTRINIGPVLEWRFAGPFLFEITGGISANRKLEYEDIASKRFNADAKTGPFIGAGIFFSPMLKPKAAGSN